MNTSFILISTLLVLSVFLPFLYFVYNGAKNTVSIKKQANELIKNNGLVYSAKESWRKNFIAISDQSNVITFIQFGTDTSNIITDINLNDLKACNIIKNYNHGTNKSLSLKNLSLEFIYKAANKPNTSISFFDIDADLTEDFELQRIEKWHDLIKNALNNTNKMKMAS